MARIARVVLPDYPHHVTQRGIRRFDIFREREDRDLYLECFGEASRRFGLTICAYCLMTNHVHFVAIPVRRDSIWKTFHRCHCRYAKRFNLKYGLAGHLFQGRPFSTVLDDRHFWSAMRYFERNPVRAKMVARAEDYEWSSAAAHCGLKTDSLLDSNWSALNQIPNLRQWLNDTDDDDTLFRIRADTFSGRPCGDGDFVGRVEAAVDRRLRPRKRGPKPSPITEETGNLWTDTTFNT
jgi:putative transposase